MADNLFGIVFGYIYTRSQALLRLITMWKKWMSFSYIWSPLQSLYHFYFLDLSCCKRKTNNEPTWRMGRCASGACKILFFWLHGVFIKAVCAECFLRASNWCWYIDTLCVPFFFYECHQYSRLMQPMKSLREE